MSIFVFACIAILVLLAVCVAVDQQNSHNIDQFETRDKTERRFGNNFE